MSRICFRNKCNINLTDLGAHFLQVINRTAKALVHIAIRLFGPKPVNPDFKSSERLARSERSGYGDC